MIERAARALATATIPEFADDKIWREDLPLYRKREAAPSRYPLALRPISQARAALFAAFDPEDEALVERFGADLIAAMHAEAKHLGFIGEKEGGQVMARIALRLLRGYSAQGVTTHE